MNETKSNETEIQTKIPDLIFVNKKKNVAPKINLS